ncbi:MAG TPA: efflux RND transporter periplasmic adaptor subunit [Gemmatimonadaceae bacterium]|jgi:RND family efflux transporter MFP subunit
MRRFLILCALVGVGASCGHGADAADDTGAGPPPVVGARTALATKQPFVETVDAIGTVAARPWALAALSAPAPARVDRIDVSVGERVRAGATLVELDHAPFDAAVTSAQAAVASAQAAFDRATRLADQGISPRKDAETASSDLAQARGTLLTAQRNQTLATLRSPIAGVVTRLGAALGQSVDPGQSIVEVADPAALDIVLSLSPDLAARVHPGDSVSLVAGANAGGEALGHGTVQSVAVTLDSATRSVGVRARLDHPARALRIGETVFGRIGVAVHADAVSVPVQALVPEGEGYRVYVVDSSGVAHARDVDVGARTEADAEILKGVSAGERVVTYGAYGVADSAKIIPVKP